MVSYHESAHEAPETHLSLLKRRNLLRPQFRPTNLLFIYFALLFTFWCAAKTFALI